MIISKKNSLYNVFGNAQMRGKMGFFLGREFQRNKAATVSLVYV